MLHIILVILKIIGIVLASALSLLLLILLVALFVPVRYRVRARREGSEIYGEGKVSYLLHILTATAEYKDGKPDFKIRIFGIPLKGKKSKKLKKVKTKRSRKKAAAEEGTKLLTADPDDIIDLVEVEPEIINGVEETVSHEYAGETKSTDKIEGVFEIEDVDEPDAEETDNSENTKNTSVFLKIKDYLCAFFRFVKGIPGIFSKISDVWKKIKSAFKNIKGQFSKYWGILRAEESKALFRNSKKELWYLLKHFRPREAKGYIRFGTGDPASTGQILGISCIFLPIYSSKIQVYPDFENSIYEGSIQIKGHIRACHFLKAGWKIYRDKNLKKFLKRIKE